jgi:hypothetical protein
MERLSRAQNGAAYPTLKDAGLDRRFLLASVGAAALAVGLSCSTAGDPPPYPPWPTDASVDASVEMFTGADAGGLVAPDASETDGGTPGAP